ncbi:SDR family NAD(P)-dependent oxidoreductase [Blastopirellula sp. JC732]|uniref:UDP-glucuronate decarboxylase n=1 Tax=Blastopirellula sediminis TaxID=2894196 RepID=A0A9X1SI74_9BACT|nr:SDR family NAD(P)-dependent oxidoreductase [Blastopirellula sediminis]MCC9605698.1 SDR family NAD(P)-dependent oxidoreductase [Blastopirellula sediminis]MCC9631002.1 SDR family NAD(P)-dependent oxidoreductase [Blastopirellula sediminis]
MTHALVTGGAGFIGSHLCEALLARGRTVTAIDDESTGSRQNLAHLIDHEHFRFVSGTVADRELVKSLLVQANEVYHLAAAVGVALIQEEPIQTIERNIYPTELLLAEIAALRDSGHDLKMFLASTSEVYGKNPKATWTEEDDLVFGSTTRPRWSYGASKAIDEFLALAYWQQRKTPTVIGRFFNVVGPRQTGAYGMVLPRFVEATLSGKGPTVHSDGGQIRCFAHVKDVVSAVIQLVETPSAAGQVFNIGSDRPVTILELAQMVIGAIDPSLSPSFQAYEEAFGSTFEDVIRRVPDLTKLRSTIDYQPKYDLEAIIQDVIVSKKAELAARES